MAYATLTVDLTAKLTNLQAGMNQAVAVAQQASGRMQAAFAGVTTAFAALGAAGVLAGLSQGLANAVNELADLDDAAEQTGASVESLSSTLNTLAPTGVGLADVVDVASRLTRAMQGAGEDTGKAAEAFKALGIATRDAAGLRPVEEVLDDLAKSLARYEDGTRKTAIAQAIFGKAGAEVLPLLKDLATRTRESSTVTGEQAAQAERLANGWRTLGVEATKLRQSIASEVIPGLADLAEQFAAVGRAGGSMWDRVRGALGPNKALRDLESDLAGLTDQRSVAERLGFSAAALADFDARIAAIRARIQSLQPALRIANGPTVREHIFGGAAYGPLPALPQAPAISGADAKGRASSARDFEDYAARIGRAAAEAVNAADIVKAKEFADTLERLDSLFFDAGLDAQIYDGAVRALTRSTAVAGDDGIGKLNRALDEQAEKFLQLVDPLRTYRRDLAALDEQERLYAESGGQRGLSPFQAAVARGTLQAKFEPGAITDETEKLNDAVRDLGLTFSSAFEDAVVGGKSLSDVLGSLADDVTRIFLRQQFTAPLAEALGGAFGKATGGQTIFDAIFGAFGGTRALGGNVDAGRTYLVGERGPEWFTAGANGRITPNRGIGAPAAPVTHIYNIDSRTDRSVIVADIQRAQLAALGAQRDARERGNEAFA